MRYRYAQQRFRRACGLAAALCPALQRAERHAHQRSEFGLRHADPVARFGDGWKRHRRRSRRFHRVQRAGRNGVKLSY